MTVWICWNCGQGRPCLSVTKHHTEGGPSVLFCGYTTVWKELNGFIEIHELPSPKETVTRWD